MSASVKSTARSDLERAKKDAYDPVFRRIAVPSFASLSQERQHRKERLAGGFRIFAALGFSAQ